MDLTKTSDIKLFINIRKNRNTDESLRELSNRHRGYIIKVFKKYFSSLAIFGISYEELLAGEFEILFNAAKSFKKKKGAKPGTWISSCARFYCLNFLPRKRKKRIAEHLIDRISEEIPITDKDWTDFQYVDFILSSLKDPNTRRIFDLRYFSDKNMSWRKIASIIGGQEDIIKRTHDKTCEMIRNKIKSNNICDLV